MRLLWKILETAHFWGIFIGVVFSFMGAEKILTGEPEFYRGYRALLIPAWVGWIQLPFGLWVLFLSIRALWRNRNTPKPVVNLDEEAVRAEAELDAMYLREHGELPQKPPKNP